MQRQPLYPFLASVLLLGLLAACERPATGPARDVSLLPVAVPADALTAGLDEPMPRDPAVIVGRLDNGLSFFIRANDEPANRAEVWLAIDVGSVLEDDDQLGLAHVLEHMAFNGTQNFPRKDLVDFLESIGMQVGTDINASTGFDQTVYTLRVPTDSPEPLRTAFAIVEDWIDRIALEAGEVEKERGVVVEEWRGGRDANTRVQTRQIETLLAGSRYAERLPIGTPESLESFDPASLRRFYDDWYRPDLMALIVVGDVDAAAVEADVRARFGALPAQEDARERTRYTVPAYEGTRISVTTDPELPTTTVAVAYRLEDRDEPTIGGERQTVVESLYAGMFSLRLAELTRQADPPFVSAGGSRTEAFLNTGPAFVLSALVQGDRIHRALETLILESERALRFGFTEAEFARARTQLLRGIERQYEVRGNRTSASFASSYASVFLRGVAAPGIEYEAPLLTRFVNGITLDEVNRVGGEWVRDTNRAVLVMAPEREDLRIPSEDELLVIVDGADDAEIEPYTDSGGALELLPELPEGGTIVAESQRPIGLTEWRLANGVRVILKPTDFDEDVILFRAYSPGGMSLATDEELVPARTALRILANAGLGNLDATQLRQAMTGKVASANPYIEEFYEGLNGSGSPRDLEAMMQLIYLWFTSPRVDDAAFGVFRAQAELILGNRDRNPAMMFEERFNEIMFQEHPRRAAETLEMLAAADAARSLEFYRDRFADAGDFTFTFVGAIDMAAMRPLVEQYLGALPSAGREEVGRDLGIREPRGIVEETLYKGSEPVGRTRIAMSVPIDLPDVEERTQHAATMRVLQSRLRVVLREELGATYGVNVGGGTGWLPEQRAAILIEFRCDPARVDELVDLIFAEIEALKASGPDEAEVADVREALTRQFEVNLEQNQYWLGTVSAGDQYGFDTGEAWREAYPAAIAALSPAIVQDGMRQFVDTANYVRLTLLPESMAP